MFMKLLKIIAITAPLSFALSYALVLVFLMFGPVYVNGELAMDQSRTWTAILSVILFIPVFIVVKKKWFSSSIKDQERDID